MESILYGLRLGSTFITVMGFGHCLYISAVEVAARRRLPSAESMIDHFQATFPLAKKYSQGLGAIPTLMSVAHYFLHPDHPSSKLLLFAGLSIISIGPYTKFFILPTNNQLLDGDSKYFVILKSTFRNKARGFFSDPKKKGESWIRSTLEVWSRRHFVRTLIFGADALIFMYATCQ